MKVLALSPVPVSTTTVVSPGAIRPAASSVSTAAAAVAQVGST